jgi:hypothetical protein
MIYPEGGDFGIAAPGEFARITYADNGSILFRRYPPFDIFNLHRQFEQKHWN